MSEPTAKPAAVAPAILKTGMDAHGMRFVPRHQIQDYRDRLYHGKTEFNYQGIPYRQPKRIERLHAADRLAVHGRQPVSDAMLVALAQDFYERTGNFPPNTCRYPGPHTGNYTRGLTVPGVGMICFELKGDGDQPEAYLE